MNFALPTQHTVAEALLIRNKSDEWMEQIVAISAAFQQSLIGVMFYPRFYSRSESIAGIGSAFARSGA